MNRCLWCGSSVTSVISVKDFIQFKIIEHPLCEKCRNNLNRLENHETCKGCSRIYSGQDYCPDCLKWKRHYPSYEGCHYAVFEYNLFARELIEQFKFTGDCETADLFKKEVGAFFRKNMKDTIVIPIPLSAESFSSRGFNQTEVLLESAGVDFVCVLENNYQIGKQSRKNRAERMKSPQPFALSEHHKDIVRGNNIILADDIYTTGRTIYHAIELIRSHEPATVNSFSLFR